MTPLRILVHDYSGHPFQIQLSRELAARGHTVCHAYSESFLTPHGALERRHDDAQRLTIVGLSLGSNIDKQAFIRRWFQERRYGTLLASLIRDVRPEIVLSANTPLDALSLALSASRRVGAKFVFWMQDIYSVAISAILGRRLGWLGCIVGWRYRRLEADVAKGSDGIVVITKDFVPVITGWGVPFDRVAVIPNWASTAEIAPRKKANAWACNHGFDQAFCFVYSGTLGMKHNPNLLLQLAAAFRSVPSVKVVVVSEGEGANWLRAQKDRLGLANLELLPFQPYADLANLLGSADVLVAILEPDAGVYSVPSKVLSYLCAGRALLLAVPAENLAARIVADSGAGVIVDPSDAVAFVTQARRLHEDGVRRAESGQNALEYAIRNFDIRKVTDRFERAFQATIAGR